MITGWANGVTTERASALLSDGNDDIIISVGGAGGRLITEQRGQQVTLERGHIHVVSNAEPFSLTHLTSRTTGLTVSRKAIAALVPDIEDRIAHPLPRFPEGLHLLEGYIGALRRCRRSTRRRRRKPSCRTSATYSRISSVLHATVPS